MKPRFQFSIRSLLIAQALVIGACFMVEGVERHSFTAGPDNQYRYCGIAFRHPSPVSYLHLHAHSIGELHIGGCAELRIPFTSWSNWSIEVGQDHVGAIYQERDDKDAARLWRWNW